MRLAGGADLVLKMRLRQIVPEQVVSLQKVRRASAMYGG